MANSDEDARYRHIYTQLVLKNHFKVIFSYLSPRARNERDREALRWLAEQAADIGLVDAYEALANATTAPEKRKMYLLIGGRIATGAVKKRLDAQADRIILPPDLEKKARESAGQVKQTAIQQFGAEDKKRLRKSANYVAQ